MVYFRNIYIWSSVILTEFILIITNLKFRYIIKPEINMAESRASSCMSDPIESSQSCDELMGLSPGNDENFNNHFGNDSKSKRHTICVINEEDSSALRFPHIESPPSEKETSNV